MTELVTATAEIDGDYRYSLTRVWDPEQPPLTFVLLNPSTADASQLDPTLRRCVSFARRDGFGGIVILNLYAYRTPYPKVMMAATDPVGPRNDLFLSQATGTVVAGWGTNARQDRVAEAVRLLPELYTLGVTKQDHPRHPLYVPGAAPLVRWSPSP